MIISASRRTDIPAYYSEWFFNRIREGFVQVRNPLNHHQVSGVALKPDIVDCIVFWSKNPAPMIDSLRRIKDYAYYFQFTLNAYNSDIETRLPDKTERINTFLKLAEKTGPERVVWRYDPVLLNDSYTTAWHIEKFGETARKLKGYTKKVTFSFIDIYKKTADAARRLNITTIGPEEQRSLAEQFAAIARENDLLIDACAESIDLSKYGIDRARCIDDALIAKITGRDFAVKKDKNQRPECGCAASVDIGAYNSCLNGCLYCYANSGNSVIESNVKCHDPLSPELLSGQPSGQPGAQLLPAPLPAPYR
jgi:DNA repair photolyase